MELVKITKALSDASRLRILRLIMDRELCVCQIIETIRLAPSTVSRHLLILRHAGLIGSRKHGRWIHYRLVAARNPVLAAALALAKKGLDGDLQVAGDLKRLKTILRTDPDLLCRKQARR